MTVRLYVPGDTPVRGNVPDIFVADRDATVPGIAVLPLMRRMAAPETNFVPVIVIVMVPLLYPDTGVIEDIAGLGFRIYERISPGDV